VIVRSREAEAFLDAVGDIDPRAITSCDGWTAHDITAHVTGIAVEVNRHLDPFLQGDAVPKTRGFEEREQPLQAMRHLDLLLRLDLEEQRMRTLVANVIEVNPDVVIPWTGRLMEVAKFIPHLRNEHALHRWDIVGDDELGITLLSEADLTAHSVLVLGRILLVAGQARDSDPEADLHVSLRSVGERDISVLLRDGEASLNWNDVACDQPGIVSDPAARLLFIWGRRPEGRGRLQSHLAPHELARLQILLSGY
jgi:Mycothiol maleylpyruvate isomerase N-terminal domain